MEKGIKSFSAQVEYKLATIELIRHERADEMRKEVKDRFDDAEVFLLENQSDIKKITGLTIGRYDQTGKPFLTVFIPYEMTIGQYREIIPHEAFHIVMALLRNDLSNTMYPSQPVHISNDETDINAVFEEPVAVMVGEVTQLIWHMIDAIEPEIIKAAFNNFG